MDRYTMHKRTTEQMDKWTDIPCRREQMDRYTMLREKMDRYTMQKRTNGQVHYA